MRDPIRAAKTPPRDKRRDIGLHSFQVRFELSKEAEERRRRSEAENKEKR